MNPVGEAGYEDVAGGFVLDVAGVDPASLAANTTRDEAITVPASVGLLLTDAPTPLLPNGLEAGLQVGPARVVTATRIDVRISNHTAAAIDPAARTWSFLIFRR